MGTGQAFLEKISQRQSPETYRQEHWQGSFSDYLDLVKKTPDVTRTAYQRLYDMVMEYGTYPVEGTKEGLIRMSPWHGSTRVLGEKKQLRCGISRPGTWISPPGRSRWASSCSFARHWAATVRSTRNSPPILSVGRTAFRAFSMISDSPKTPYHFDLPRFPSRKVETLCLKSL